MSEGTTREEETMGTATRASVSRMVRRAYRRATGRMVVDGSGQERRRVDANRPSLRAWAKRELADPRLTREARAALEQWLARAKDAPEMVSEDGGAA